MGNFVLQADRESPWAAASHGLHGCNCDEVLCPTRVQYTPMHVSGLQGGDAWALLHFCAESGHCTQSQLHCELLCALTQQ